MYWRGASFIPYFLMRLELPDLSIIVGEEPFLDDVIGDFWWKVGDL